MQEQSSLLSSHDDSDFCRMSAGIWLECVQSVAASFRDSRQQANASLLRRQAV